MQRDAPDVADMEAKAEEAARVLATLANGKRLLALCHMLDGEKSVGQLAELVGLAPSALSQHLARMRDLRLVDTRRDGQTIHYRIASTEVIAIIETLYRLYCAPGEADPLAPALMPSQPELIPGDSMPQGRQRSSQTKGRHRK
jgi:DNA-binding transcriptional ArsR family regulator